MSDCQVMLSESKGTPPLWLQMGNRNEVTTGLYHDYDALVLTHVSAEISILAGARCARSRRFYSLGVLKIGVEL